MPPLPGALKESLQSYLGTKSQEKKLRVCTPRGKTSGNMEAAGIGVNQGEGLPRITSPTAQIERLRIQPHLNTPSVSASLIYWRGAVGEGRNGCWVQATQSRAG